MNFKKISLLILILLIADQLLKIWVKTHMHLDESIIVFPDWFQLRFIENNGAAFGMHIASKGGFICSAAGRIRRRGLSSVWRW